MERRRWLLGLCASALVAPARLVAQAKVWRIGVLTPTARELVADAIREGMAKLGYVEGRNVSYEWRFTEGRFDPLPAMAAELVGLKVDVIVAGSTPATRAALDATRTIPIVMVNTGDPIGSGFIASLARPGGNVTGVTNINVETNAKRVELLGTIVPRLSRLAILLNPANPTYRSNRRSLEEAAARAGYSALVFDARTREEIERAFSAMRAQQAQAVIVQIDSFFNSQARVIGVQALAARLPAVTPRPMLDHGALLTYQQDMRQAFGRAPLYVDRILKGAKPGDLPVEQPTKLHLAVSLRSAKALGVSLPRELIMLADEVVE